MIKRLFSSQLRVNMTSGVITTLVNTVVVAAGYPMYLHFLGYEQYGLWLVLSVVLTFAQLGNLGMGPAITKLVAEEYGRGNHINIRRTLVTAVMLLCLSGAVVLVGIVMFKSQIVSLFKLSGDNAQAVSTLLPYIGILSIYVFIVQALDGTLSGLGRMDLTNYIQSLSRIVAIVTAGILLYRGYGIVGLLVGNTLSYLCNHVLTYLCIRRIVPLPLPRASDVNLQCCERILRFGGAVFGSSLISMLFSPFNKLMLSRYAGVASIPVYEIAFTGSMQVRSLIEAGLRPLMPEVSRLNGMTTKEAGDRIIRLQRRAMRLILSAGIPIYAALALFASLLLKLWLGDRFVETLPGAFRIMLLGTFLSLLGVPAYYNLMGRGYVYHNLASHIFQSFVNAAVLVIGVLLTSTTSSSSVGFAAASGMAASTAYLMWRQAALVKNRYWDAGRPDSPRKS